MRTPSKPFQFSVFSTKHFFSILLLSLFSGLAFANESVPSTQVIMKTTLGEITLELADQDAPITTKNFLGYIENGFYEGTVFHRVIDGFMIQGGGFDEKMQKKPTQASIKNEAKNGLKNLRGTIAMARTQVVDSATSQFFINLVDNKALNHGVRDYGYTVFGKVIKGLDVVDAIGKTRTQRKGRFANLPKTPIQIISIEVINTKPVNAK